MQKTEDKIGDAVLSGIAQDTAQALGLLLDRFPALARLGWDTSYVISDAAVNYLHSVDAARFYLNREPIGPQVVASPARCWVQIFWNGQDVILDFAGSEVVITEASDPRYTQMREMEWPEE
jgi:hypothetical protein